MTTLEFARTQVDGAKYQLDQTFAGLEEKDLDFKAHPSMMSACEHLEHLCEAYTACVKQANGEEHEWGSFVVDDRSLSNLLTVMAGLRQEAVDALFAKEAYDAISDFLVLHDAYHVGQLCATRQALDPEWNSYVIYR